MKNSKHFLSETTFSKEEENELEFFFHRFIFEGMVPIAFRLLWMVHFGQRKMYVASVYAGLTNHSRFCLPTSVMLPQYVIIMELAIRTIRVRFV